MLLNGPGDFILSVPEIGERAYNGLGIFFSVDVSVDLERFAVTILDGLSYRGEDAYQFSGDHRPLHLKWTVIDGECYLGF